MQKSELLNEHIYDQERADEFVAGRAKMFGMSRRDFAFRFAAGALASVALPSFGQTASVAQTDQSVLKPAPPEFFRRSGSNLEMRWEAMYNRGYIVPNELFFVRNNSPVVPRIDQKLWQLKIEGTGVSRPRTFSYNDILSMPSVSVIRSIECAGNGRDFFEISHGKKIAGTPWNLGGIGVAEWTGVPLREILDRCGLKRTARDVMPEGLDEKRVSRPMPVLKALADDTLVVYAMNGQPLMPDHGFPVRILVPGWVGIGNVKWLGRIEVSETALYTEYNTKKYIMIGPDYKPNPPALGPALTTQKVKSAFELPWDGETSGGQRLLRGRSWSGEGRITKVDVSLDGGKTWQHTRLREPNIAQAWVRWDLDWDATPGSYKLQARATDNKGNTQPDRIPFNEEGYFHWAVVTHPIRVK